MQGFGLGLAVGDLRLGLWFGKFENLRFGV